MQVRSPTADGVDSSAVRRFRPSNSTEKSHARNSLLGRGRIIFRSTSPASRRAIIFALLAAGAVFFWILSTSRSLSRIGTVSAPGASDGDSVEQGRPVADEVGRQLSEEDLCANPEKLGDDYGGWTICNARNVAGGIVYTIGIGRNIEWDKAMISRFGTVHHGWDPTPSAQDFFRKKAPPPGFTYHEYGLGVEDGNVTVKLPEGNLDSYTIMKYKAAAKPGTVISIPVLTVRSMLRMLGHERIAILKIDCEGVEFSVIADWARTGYRPPAKQILIEFHERYFTRETAPGGISPSRLVGRAIAQMKSLGFQMLHKHHWEYTFVQSDSAIGS